MFDTERFIIEVQNRVCLWDSREKPDRTAKKRAWEEIAKILYDNWDSETEIKQRELGEFIILLIFYTKVYLIISITRMHVGTN